MPDCPVPHLVRCPTCYMKAVGVWPTAWVQELLNQGSTALDSIPPRPTSHYLALLP